MKKNKHIKSSLILIVFFLFSLLSPSMAQISEKSEIIPLKNNKYLSVQVCTDKIFRIRISNKPVFPESLMERYGIIKSDWNSVNKISKKGNNTKIIQTDNFRIYISLDDGSIAVKDLKGNLIIDKINFENNNSSIDSLNKSLNNYFYKNIVKGKIIGDENSNSLQLEKGTVENTIKNNVLAITLKNNERFYGGGSTSRKNIQHRGEALRIWSTYQETEIPIPFLMSSNNWGIFNNTTSLNYFDVGRYDKNKFYIFNTNENIDFYLMLGNSYEEVLQLYTTVTQKPYIMPKWAYGLVFGGNTMENQMDLMNDAIRFRDEKIPCDIFWIEPQWMAKKYDFSTTKSWDQKMFSGEPYWEEKNENKREHPLLFISKLHKLGFKLALWLCVDHDLSIEEEVRIAKQTNKAQSGQVNWFQHLTKFIDQGVDGFKLDPARTLDEHPDRKYYNGYTDKEMHNLNQVLLSKQMNITFREHKNIRSFHHYCGGYAGSQHWGASTSGDNGGGKDALFDQLNLGLSGFVNTSADVLEVMDNNEKGAIHLGFFLPWVQVNSWYALHHPWYLAPTEKETFKYYAQLRNSLNPYIYSAAIEGYQTGMPILRAMPLEFPDDRKVDNLIYQFMFGKNLLVGVFGDSIYLPKGNWINYWTNEKIAGGKTIQTTVPINRGGPLFVRAGAIIPFQKPHQYLSNQVLDTLILKIYPQNKSSYTFLEDDGITFDYEKGKIAKTKYECVENEENIEITIQPTEGEYNGISASRTYLFEIVTDITPNLVTLNGKEYKNWKIDKKGILSIQLLEKPIENKQILKIHHSI